MSDLGDLVPLRVEITDSAGALANAGAVAITITQPDRTVVGPTSVNPTSTGIYDFTFTPTMAGRHEYRWVATGANASEYKDVFNVDNALSGAIISLEQAKTQLAKTGTADDEAIRGYIRAASDIVNTCCGYTAPTTIVETVNGRADASGRSILVLAKGPVLSVTSIATQMQGLPTIDTSGLVVNADAGTVYLSNWMPFYGPLTVTYVAGRNGAVPQVLQDACALLVQWLWRTRRGGATRQPDQGGQDELVTFKGIAMPAEVAAMLSMSPYTAAPGIA